MNLRLVQLSLPFIFFLSTVASADDCMRTLIPDRTQVSSNRYINYTNIRRLSQSEYNSQRQGGGLSGEIKGIPFSADYSATQEFLSSLSDLTQVHYSETDLIDIDRSNLSETNARIYMSCIQQKDILSVIAKDRSQNSVTIEGRWSPQGQNLKEIKYAIISGATSSEPSFKPLPNAPWSLDFNRRLGEEFVVKVVAELETGEQISRTVRIPWVPEIVLKWAEIQRSSVDEDIQSDNSGRFWLGNHISEGGETTRSVTISSRIKFYIVAETLAVDMRKEDGLNDSAVSFGPLRASDQGVYVDARKIEIRMHVYQPAHHGGSISMGVSWKEVTPIVYVDGTVRAPLPPWTTKGLSSDQIDDLKKANAIQQE